MLKLPKFSFSFLIFLVLKTSIYLFKDLRMIIFKRSSLRYSGTSNKISEALLKSFFLRLSKTSKIYASKKSELFLLC